jgi:hypothetical protein
MVHDDSKGRMKSEIKIMPSSLIIAVFFSFFVPARGMITSTTQNGVVRRHI